MTATFDYGIGDAPNAAGYAITLGFVAVAQLIMLIVLVAVLAWGVSAYKKAVR